MPDHPLYNEQELLLQIAKGNEAAFTTLIRHHWKNVYGHALAWLKSAEEAEELTQDVFLKVWNSRDRLTEITSFENWLFIIARNVMASAFRKKIETPSFLTDQYIEESSLRPDHLMERQQHYQILLAGIALLPDKRQQVFRMSRLEGLSHNEIAAKLGMHKDTVAQYIVKAVVFLKSYLQEHIHDNLLVILLLGGLA